MQTTATSSAPQFSRAGVIWLKLAVLYLVLGVLMGTAMGATQNFTLRPVHAHVNLLGWATLALAGLIYTVFPEAGASRLARLHFWLLNISLPLMMISLAIVLLGNPGLEPLVGLASVGAVFSVLVFAANLFINLKK